MGGAAEKGNQGWAGRARRASQSGGDEGTRTQTYIANIELKARRAAGSSFAISCKLRGSLRALPGC